MPEKTKIPKRISAYATHTPLVHITQIKYYLYVYAPLAKFIWKLRDLNDKALNLVVRRVEERELKKLKKKDLK